ncbi:unnamed protein product [Phyllotreta striolata]|uniref:Small ribosomal subunit protein mS39 n=1 Tax=Phyllotreta striolata TaxID=444603 RepID=A0A9N9TFM7_PHYSR|nr:unnamed protein product [Phyllotreta striolata]
MNLPALISKRPPAYFYASLNVLRRSLSQAADEERIEIPKRIHRGPTDILKALEKTISRDPTAAHYKYHDDPYLIPMSNIGKRTFAMAQESGRKSAHWIRKEHADLFNHKEADPAIPSFFPKLVYNENSQVTIEDLTKAIEEHRVQDAQFIYNLLKKSEQEVNDKLKQMLLELVCYFNCDDSIDEEFIEERWFKQSSNLKDRMRKTWKDGSFAEELFQSVTNPTADTYSAIIQGMNKYFQADRAWKLFEESQAKGLVLTTDAYNSLIRVTNFLKESADKRLDFITNILSDMNKCGVAPNLGTLNAVLHSLSSMGSNRSAREFLMGLLSEFRTLGIEPSLGSWYYVMITFYKERSPPTTVLYEIMNQIKDKEHSIRDLSDTNFFVTAMDVCRNHLNDVELAKRINDLLHYGDNYNLIGDSFKESIYYRHYVILMVANTPLEEFMRDIYDLLVPNIYIPEPGVMNEILKQIELNGIVEYLPKIWSDMVSFDHANRENLVDYVVDIMIENPQPENPSLTEHFSKIAWDIYKRIEEQNVRKIGKISATGGKYGKMMALLLRNNDFEQGCKIMEKLDKEHQTIPGVPRLEDLELFIDHCIENKMPSRAIACIQYCSDSGFAECGALASKLNEKLTLDESHLQKLFKIVGDLKLSDKISQEQNESK